MKKNILLNLTIGLCTICLIFSCKNLKVDSETYKSLVYAREIITEQRDSITNLTNIIVSLNDSITMLNSDLEYNKKIRELNSKKLEQTLDSLSYYKEDALVYKYKIERIKAYDKIVRNNSSQSKFFLGWVRRVLED